MMHVPCTMLHHNPGLPAGVERIFVSMSDPAFDEVGRENNSGVYCVVDNTSNPPGPTNYELSVLFFNNQPQLRQEDRDALHDIYTSCCSAPGSCAKWRKLSKEGSTGPFLDFCSLSKQGCDARGRLLQLNVDGWDLRCPFPAEPLSRLNALLVLRLGSGNAFTGNVASALATLGDKLIGLEVLHVAGNRGMQGTLIDPRAQVPAGTSPPLCRMATTLRLLQLAGNHIEVCVAFESVRILTRRQGTIPACLIGPSSSLLFLDLGMNRLGGSIPDAWDANSPMTDLFLDGVRAVTACTVHQHPLHRTCSLDPCLAAWETPATCTPSTSPPTDSPVRVCVDALMFMTPHEFRWCRSFSCQRRKPHAAPGSPQPPGGRHPRCAGHPSQPDGPRPV